MRPACSIMNKPARVTAPANIKSGSPTAISISHIFEPSGRAGAKPKNLLNASIMVMSLVIFFLFVNPLFSNGMATTYLVYRSSFTNSQINAVKGYGYASNGQPAKITEFIQAPNTNYARITLSTRTDGENSAIQSLLSQGKIQALSSLYLKNEYDGRVGGNVSWVEIVDCKSNPIEFICYPPDWNKDWELVEVSSQ